jgi:nucleotide-binding universal stress UspA family protein
MTPSEAPFVSSIFHPSDFSEASLDAFAHALAIALVRQTELTILHSGADFLGADEWTKFPAVRKTLERWGLLAPGSPRSAIFDELKVRIKKVNLRKLSPLAASLEYLEKHPTDLIVLSTAGREGPPRWIRPSKAESLARHTGILALFVPEGGRGFISAEDGELNLRTILIPVDHSPSPDTAITYATRAATALRGDDPVEIVLLHVGEGEVPQVLLPESADYSFRVEQRSGDVTDAITTLADEIQANLIVMATHGHDDFLDVLRGSVTEQALRRAPCPLLAVPAQ